MAIPHYPRVSVAIPLHGSREFLDTIIENIQGIDYPNVEIVISDRHCLDDAIDVLADRYRNDQRFRILKATDAINWVEHYNLLLRTASGKYFRWLPHDDILPGCCLREMVSYLEKVPEAVLVYGPTEALDVAGDPLPRRNDLNPHPVSDDAPWTFDISVNLFFRGYCNGAFKGLFKRDLVISRNLFIKLTHQCVHAERCWLFGLSLIGRFGFLSTYRYRKRYHDRSTHAQWRLRYRHKLSACWVMGKYLRELVDDRRKVLTGTCALLVGLLVHRRSRKRRQKLP